MRETRSNLITRQIDDKVKNQVRIQSAEDNIVGKRIQNRKDKLSSLRKN